VYDAAALQRRHEQAGLETLTVGYAGFYDGFVSEVAPSTRRWRRRTHHAMSRASNLAAQARISVTHGRFAPESAWLAPTIYYVGRRV
jgi:hypothetical protein